MSARDGPKVESDQSSLFSLHMLSLTRESCFEPRVFMYVRENSTAALNLTDSPLWLLCFAECVLTAAHRPGQDTRLTKSSGCIYSSSSQSNDL